MKRRAFLTLLPTAILLPELILPRKTFFLPPLGGWPQVYTFTTTGRTITLPSVASVALGTEYLFQAGDEPLTIRSDPSQEFRQEIQMIRGQAVSLAPRELPDGTFAWCGGVYPQRA